MYQKFFQANLQREDLTPEEDLRVRCQMLREFIKKGVRWVFTTWSISRFEFPKNKNNQAKNLLEYFTRFSFSTILKDSKHCEQIYSTTGALQQ